MSGSSAEEPSDNGSLQTSLLEGDGNSDDGNIAKEVPSLQLVRLSKTRRLVLLQPALFLKKVVLVIAASYALLPLLAYKSSLPGALYASLLVLIHVGVLILYLYKVAFRKLDADRLSLGGRLLGLGVTTWLLTVVSGWQDRQHVGVLAVQMLVLCLVHTVMLALLMVAVEEEPAEEEPGDPAVPHGALV